MRSCLQKVHRCLERSRVHWCQWYLQLCDLHSNLMNDLILVNTPPENACNISDHVTPSLWACLIICKVRWSHYKVWPQRPLPPWSSVVTKCSCNHLGEMTSGKVQPYWQRERPAKARGLVDTSFSFFPDKHLTFLWDGSPGSGCVPFTSPFFRRVQQPACSPKVLFIHFTFLMLRRCGDHFPMWSFKEDKLDCKSQESKHSFQSVLKGQRFFPHSTPPAFALPKTSHKDFLTGKKKRKFWPQSSWIGPSLVHALLPLTLRFLRFPKPRAKNKPKHLLLGSEVPLQGNKCY